MPDGKEADSYYSRGLPFIDRMKEPTVRTDTRQVELAGSERTAKQAQSSRDAGGGTLRGKKPQEALDFGLFDSAHKQQKLNWN